MRHCSLFFLLWWTIFICIAFQQMSKPHRTWQLAKTKKQSKITLKTSPVYFKNASIEWIDMINDYVSIQVITNTTMGKVNISNLHMQVFEDINRTTLSEIYNIPWTWVPQQHNLTFIQNDVHLSPYRRLVLHPKIHWTLGDHNDVAEQNYGRFVKNTWQEGYDQTTSMGIAFIAWFAGLLFLVFTRPQPNIRQPRILIQYPKSNIKQ